MKAKAVVNASPLIFLAKLDRLELLPRPCATTRVVIEEVRAGREAGYHEALSVEGCIQAGAIVIKDPDQGGPPGGQGLHPGEASVIALARELKITQVVVDDLAAIRMAKVYGLQPVSTPFLVLRERKRGALGQTEYKAILKRLVDLGYYLSGPLYERLVVAGEDA